MRDEELMPLLSYGLNYLFSCRHSTVVPGAPTEPKTKPKRKKVVEDGTTTHLANKQTNKNLTSNRKQASKQAVEHATDP